MIIFIYVQAEERKKLYIQRRRKGERKEHNTQIINIQLVLFIAPSMTRRLRLDFSPR